MTTPADELRAAAKLIRERAEKATPGPYLFDVMSGQQHETGEWWAEYWVQASQHPSGVLVQVGNDEQAEADAEHIATWSPPPALAVAAWLEQTAERHHDEVDGRVHATCPTCMVWDEYDVGFPEEYPCADVAAALAVAQAIGGQT